MVAACRKVDGKVKVSRKGMSSRSLTSYQLAEFDQKTALLTPGGVAGLAEHLAWTSKQLISQRQLPGAGG